MLSLIALMHYRFVKNMTSISFDFMQEASFAAFQQITEEMATAESRSASTARLIQLSVIDPDNLEEMVAYTTDLILSESIISPSIQSVYWADENGTFVMAERTANNTISSEIINRSKLPASSEYIYRNTNGQIIKTIRSFDLNYDPRMRPWYLTGKILKKTAWMPAYRYQRSGFLGTSVLTPVFYPSGKLHGIVNLNIRLDYLRRQVEGINISPHGIAFIVDSDGKIIAFPKVIQDRNSTLLNISSLPYPWVIQTFNYYKKHLSQKFLLNYAGKNYLAIYKPLLHFGSHEWFIGTVAPQDDFTTELRKTHMITIVFALIMLMLSIAIVSALISNTVNPLKTITNEIKKIKNFELEDRPPVQSHISEVVEIAQAIHSMKQGLRAFQKYVPATLVRQLIQVGEAAQVGGEKKSLVILFSDIQDFSMIAEQMLPDQLMQHICDYFEELSRIIVANQGTIDKYIGDAIMAFWGAPLVASQPAQHAANAALQCVNRLRALNAEWQKMGKPILHTRFGLNMGDAIVGNLGSKERLNYTAIGDTTNMASRLEGANKLYGTQIIVSESMYKIIKEDYILRMLDYVMLKGKSEAIFIYELIAEKHDPIPYDIATYNSYFAKAFMAYQHHYWDRATKYFTFCSQIYPADRVAPVFIKRCHYLQVNPPAADWNGIWRLNEK